MSISGHLVAFDGTAVAVPDTISAEERAAIKKYEEANGVTRVPRGTSGQTDADFSRKAQSDAAFRLGTARHNAGLRRARAAKADPARARPMPPPLPAPAPERDARGLARIPVIAADNTDAAAVKPWGQACSFELVDVARLRIRPHSYQRTVSRDGTRRVRRIAGAFDWAKFGALTVMPDGDEFEVIDGQHRAAAARSRGLARVPAIIVAAGAASVFLALNRDRAALDAAQLYHAELVAGEAEALALAAIFDRLGITVPRTQPQKGAAAMTTRAISALRTELRARGAAVLEAALGVIADAWADQPNAFTAEIVRGVSRAVAEIMVAPDRGRAVEAELDALAETLHQGAPEDLRREAKEAAARHGGAAHNHLARILCNRHAAAGGVVIAVGV